MEYQRAVKSAQKEQSKIPPSSLRQTSLKHVGVHPLLELQRTIGNQAVLNLLRSQNTHIDASTQAFREPRFGHDFSWIPIHPPAAGALQTKLAINKPGDQYEQEADRISEQVMRMPEPQLQRACACGGVCPKCQTEKLAQEHERLQTMRIQPGNLDQTPVPPLAHEVLASPGQPLDAATRFFMEPRFGHDFSRVRVHADAGAAESARSVDALAYTVGRHVVFGERQYSPNSMAGRQLLAHELTHVIQQQGVPVSAGLVQRKPPPPKAPTFRDCTEKTTFSSKPDQELETARVFASNLVDAAIGALAKNDGSETYRAALARHFIAPTFDERKDILMNFRRIWGILKPEKIRCASSDKDVDDCESNPEAGVTEGFEVNFETVLCSTFWLQGLPCQAITLIHEAAHAVGIGTGGGHPPYRGSAEYPSLAKAPRAGATTAVRMHNPDAYAYFAAHIGRETDTQCFGIPASRRGAIEIQDVAPEKK